MGTTILDAAAILAATLDGRRAVDDAWQAICDLEHKGDAEARDVFEMLVRPESRSPSTQNR